jgi:hypothetical protein
MLRLLQLGMELVFVLGAWLELVYVLGRHKGRQVHSCGWGFCGTFLCGLLCSNAWSSSLLCWWVQGARKKQNWFWVLRHCSQLKRMSIALVHFGWMFLFTTPTAVVLLVCIGVGGCLCPSLLWCNVGEQLCEHWCRVLLAPLLVWLGLMQ